MTNFSYDNGYGRTYKFEIVDYVPAGFEIWNIGKNMPEGWLPLIKPIGNTYDVDTTCMKVIKLEEAQTILSAVGGGQKTVEAMERYIRRYKNAKRGTWSYTQRERMIKALPIMKSLKWEEVEA